MYEQRDNVLWEVKVHQTLLSLAVTASVLLHKFETFFLTNPPTGLYWQQIFLTSKKVSACFVPLVFPQSPLKPFLRICMYGAVKPRRDIPGKDKMLKA